jgi:hypothetical protein
MRKMAWTFGFCCDLGILAFVAWLLFTTYNASVVEYPSHIPADNIILTPPTVVLPEDAHETMGVSEESQEQPQVVPVYGEWANCLRRLQRHVPTPDRRRHSLA